MTRPLKLYKFMRFREDRGRSVPTENVQRLLLQSEIRISRSDEFNDPYDCAPRLKPLSGSAQESYVENELMKEQHRSLNARERAVVREGMLRILSTEEACQSAYRKTAQQWGIYSMSSSPSSELMWAHYADSHHGLCFEFEAHPELFGKAEPVIYSDLRPIADLADVLGATVSEASVKRFMAAALRTKSSSWSYENEYRLLLRAVHGFIDFDSHLLTGIILGLKFRPEDEHHVFEAAATRAFPPAIYRATLDPDRFLIDSRAV